MHDTPNLALPLLAAGQAQKHVTYNEALVAIDVLLQCAVLDKDLASPPSSPALGARYIVAASPSGLWSGKAGTIATWQDGAWRHFPPRAGFVAFVVDESSLHIFDGTSWNPVASSFAAIQNLGLLGVGAIADSTNPFSAKLNKALWTARTAAEGGTGDLRYTLNKESAGRVLSFLFQSGYSGRLEFGLIGSDNPSVKVSPDGSTWLSSLRLDSSTGGLDFLASEGSIASAATCDLGSVLHLKVAVTGTATINSFGLKAHALRLVRFAGALTLAHDATSLILPGGASIATAAGDALIAVSDETGKWRVTQYQRASGAPLTAVFPTLSVTGSATIGGNVTASGTASASAVISGALVSSAPSYPQIAFRATAGASANRNWDFISYTGASFAGRIIADDLSAGVDWLNVSRSGVAASGITFTVASGSHVFAGGPVIPGADNAQALGTSARRWSTVYAGTGAINTSDAREKTEVAALTRAEIAAASDLARLIGSFQYRDAVVSKGADGARRHVGLTVQGAIAVMEAHGLDPFRYAFICHDAWELTEAVEAIPAAPAVLDEDGQVVEPSIPEQPAVPARPAGDRYGFRADQLALFIARGQEARLAAVEVRIA